MMVQPAKSVQIKAKQEVHLVITVGSFASLTTKVKVWYWNHNNHLFSAWVLYCPDHEGHQSLALDPQKLTLWLQGLLLHSPLTSRRLGRSLSCVGLTAVLMTSQTRTKHKHTVDLVTRSKGMQEFKQGYWVLHRKCSGSC